MYQKLIYIVLLFIIYRLSLSLNNMELLNVVPNVFESIQERRLKFQKHICKPKNKLT